MRVLRTVCTRRNPHAARLLARIDESFFRRSHCRFIYRRIRAGITARGRPPTWSNLRTDTSNRIPDREQTKRYIKLMSDVRPLPGEADAGDYDDLFDDLKRLRAARIIWDGSQGTMKALEGDNPDIDSLLDGLSDSVSSARAASTRVDTLRMSAKDDNSDEIFKELLSDERPDVVPTGFKAFDSNNRGLLKGSLLVLASNRKGGKGLSLDTPLPTPDGFVTMGDVQVGDTVYDMDGKPTKVTSVSEVHMLPCYEVTFATGETVVTDNEHRWLINKSVQVHKKHRWPINRSIQVWKKHNATIEEVVTTEELAGMVAKYRRARGARPIKVPVCKPIIGNKTELPAAPYTLGYWLGDGTKVSGQITVGTQDIDHAVAAFQEDGYDIRGPRLASKGAAFSVTPSGLVGQLRKLDVLSNKHIPLMYLRASRSDRVALMRGLMDSDGSVSETGKCEFYSMNERLARDFRELASSLGLKTTLRTKDARIYGKYYGKCYVVSFYPGHTRGAFKMPRKLAYQRLKKTTDHDRSKYRTVKNIRRVRTVPTKCITVKSPTSTYLFGRSMIPTHNTSVGIQLAINIAKQPSCFNVCVVPLEMNRKQMSARIYANEAGINKTRLIAFPLSPEEKRTLRAARKGFKEALAKSEGSLIIDDDMLGQTVEDILNVRTHEDDDVIIIDQLTLTANASPTNDRQWANMNEACRYAKTWAEKNNKVVIVVMQLDEHGNLKYSRGPAEHADLVWTWIAEELEAGEDEATINVQVLSRHQDPTPFTLGMNIYTGRVYDVDKPASSDYDQQQSQPKRDSKGRGGRKVNRRNRTERQDDTDIDSYLDTSADD